MTTTCHLKWKLVCQEGAHQVAGVPSQPACVHLTSLLPYDATTKALPTTGTQEQSHETLPPFPPQEPVSSITQSARLPLKTRVTEPPQYLSVDVRLHFVSGDN